MKENQRFSYWILFVLVNSGLLYKFYTIVFCCFLTQWLLIALYFSKFEKCWFILCESSSFLTSHMKYFQDCCCSPDTLCGLDWQALNSLAAAPICSIITRGHIDCSCLMHQDSSCSTLSLAFIYDSFLLPIIPGTQPPWGFYMARGVDRKLADT